MKQQQLSTLERLLREASPKSPSRKTDEQILRAARSALQRKQARHPILDWLFAPVSLVGNAVMAVSITAMVFLGMAKVVSLPAQQGSLSLSSELSSKQTISVKPAIESYTPDQVLLELSLPSVPDLIRSMEFMAENERTAATIELISALADINNLIESGELDNARSRYHDLKQRCYSCQLPSSLEALALGQLNAPDHG